MLSHVIARLASACVRNAGLVVIVALLSVLAAAAFVATHFRMSTDTTKMVSPELQWRKEQAAFLEKFPQPANLVLIVVDSPTPELAQMASRGLQAALRKHPDLILSLREPGAGPFFEKNGLLFLDLPQAKSAVDQLISAQPFLGALAADPSLRGIMDSLSTALMGVERGQITLDRLSHPFSALDATLASMERGQPQAHSWRRMMMEGEPDLRETRRVIEALVRVDFGKLKPGERASALIRSEAMRLGLTPEKGVRIRLTGPVSIFDEEFGSLTHNAVPIATATVGFMLLMLWIALRSLKLIIAIILTILAGLVVTTAAGLAMVGAFNIISVAFVALFVGLGVDFGIQYCVRYRAQRLSSRDLDEALVSSATTIGPSLTLAALAISAGFFGFIPTAYRGVAELGLVAGTGMLVTFALSLTLLPALLKLLKPEAEHEEAGFAPLSPVDGALQRNADSALAFSALLGGVAIALLPSLTFDFNLLNLRSRQSESISTLLELSHDPDRSPNAMDATASSLEGANALAARLRSLPEVAKVLTISDFIPGQQSEKLALISDASMLLDLSINPIEVKPAPSDQDVLDSMQATIQALRKAATTAAAAPAAIATSLADRLEHLAKGPPSSRQQASALLTLGLGTLLDNVRTLLTAEEVTQGSVPPDIARDFVAPDGTYRVRIYPKGDPTDNDILHRFRMAVNGIVPDATGVPVFLEESGRTIVGAFVQAGTISLVAITLLLFVALRRVRDVVICLVPLVLAGALTLATCVLLDLRLNYANIIALPLLFGIGVAFDIYFVMAWRQGVRSLLPTPLTRAVIFSALATSSGFGALWFSSHPGTSSMGALLMIALLWILVVVLFVIPPMLRVLQRDA